MCSHRSSPSLVDFTGSACIMWHGRSVDFIVPMKFTLTYIHRWIMKGSNCSMATPLKIHLRVRDWGVGRLTSNNGFFYILHTKEGWGDFLTTSKLTLYNTKINIKSNAKYISPGDMVITSSLRSGGLSIVTSSAQLTCPGCPGQVPRLVQTADNNILILCNLQSRLNIWI